MLICTAAAYDIPGTLVVSMVDAADTSSAGVGIPAKRTATTPPNRKNSHPCVLVYNILILGTAVPGLCYDVKRANLILVRTCTHGRLSTYSSMHLFFLYGRFDRPGVMPRCSARNTYSMVHMGRFAGNPGALAMSFFRARWSI